MGKFSNFINTDTMDKRVEVLIRFSKGLFGIGKKSAPGKSFLISALKKDGLLDHFKNNDKFEF